MELTDAERGHVEAWTAALSAEARRRIDLEALLRFLGRFEPHRRAEALESVQSFLAELNSVATGADIALVVGFAPAADLTEEQREFLKVFRHAEHGSP
jgi:hypothetical protein